MTDIFFATKRLAISSEDKVGFAVEAHGEHALNRDTLIKLFAEHDTVSLMCDDEAACFESFTRQFTPVTAAGGIVENPQGKHLMIRRNGRYDIAKGHLESGEQLEECAMREVEEETGVGSLTVKSKICETLHCYFMHERWEIKRTHWYAMTTDRESVETPQTEEGIESVEWCSREEMVRNIADSYPTINRVVTKYLGL